MEFHNAKLLPRGLPEIIAAVVPYDIYPDTKVIAYHRKGMGERPGSLGYVGYDTLTFSFHIGLYPTKCCSYGGHRYRGIPSFKFWMAMLSTALHEVGHLATRHLYIDLPDNADEDYDTYWYIEDLADKWRDEAFARILRVDPRLGQAPGALTGYPGALAYRIRNIGHPGDGSVHIGRIIEWRGLSCGGQVTIADLLSAWLKFLHPISLFELNKRSRRRFESVFYRKVHQIARELSIDRCFVNKNGRRYLMFNVGEAEMVYERLAYDNRQELVEAFRRIRRKVAILKMPFSRLTKRWELIEGTWELVEGDSPGTPAPEQMTLPLGLE